MERKYIAFISYRHAPLDSAVAKALHTQIEQYVIPKELRKKGKKKLGIVFRDQEELPVSSNLSADIRSALDHSEFLVVVCSPNTAESKWVQQEIEYFLLHHSHNQVLTVLASGEPSEVFPRALTHIPDAATGTVTEVEPLAVNVEAGSIRAMRRKLRRESPRLFAAMIGCHYDALILREQRRLRRKIIAGASAILAVVLSFCGVLLRSNYQIEQKNEELARQKAQVQQRESLLLTADAREALDSGDVITAIDSAVRALPGADDPDRPYYAEAESILFSAMNILSSSLSDQLATVTLKQMTPISDFVFCEEGAKIVTVDPYGALNCFDSSTAQTLWSTHSQSYTYTEPMLFSCGAGDIIAFAYDGRLAAVSTQTGETLWTRELSAFEDGCVYPFPDHGILGCIDVTDPTYSNGIRTEGYIYHLVLLDEKTGQELHRVPIVEVESTLDCDFSFNQMDDWVAHTALSKDGLQFAGTYSVGQSFTDSMELVYYVADLQTGSATTCFRQQLSGSGYYNRVVSLSFTDNDTALLCVRQAADNSIAATVDKIHIGDQKLLWQTQTPPESTGYYFSGKRTHTLLSGSLGVIGRGDRLYGLNLETGELLGQASLYDDLIGLEIADQYFFRFFLANGYHALGWYNSTLGFCSSAAFGAELDFEDASHMESAAGGLIEAVVSDGRINSMSISGSGYLAMVPTENELELEVMHLFDTSALVSQTPVTLPENISGVGDLRGSFCTDGTVVLGPFSSSEDDFYVSAYHYYVVDPQTNEILRSFELAGSTDTNNIFFLPDGSGYVECRNGKTLTLVNSDGSAILLEGSDRETVSAGGYDRYVSNLLHAAAVRDPLAGDLICARADALSLTVWRNGVVESSCDLPDQLQYSAHLDSFTDSYFNRRVYPGTNEYVLVNLYDYYTENNTPSLLAAWSIQEERWAVLQTDSIFPDPDAFALGQAQPILAAVDSANQLRLFDLGTGEETAVLNLQLPATSITQLHLILEDTCLMAATEDHQLLIWDLSSGEVLFRQNFESYFDQQILTYPDPENQRLYILMPGNLGATGLCVDLRSWTKLAEIDGLIFFDAAHGTAYLNAPDTPLLSRKIPSTGELVELARQLLGTE